MSALVAKSYTNLEQVGDIYQINGRDYIKVRLKNGELKAVRAYSPKEYSKYYPEVKVIQPTVSRRDVLGFGDAGYIWLFKGLTHDATYESLDWFRASPCRFARPWGWYLPSDIEMPNPLPVNVEPVKLYWDEVSSNDVLYPEDKLTKIAEALLYDAGPSEFVGSLGERIRIEATCITATSNSNSNYGTSYFYVFRDDKENLYIWNTTAKVLKEGIRYAICGTVSGHNIYRNNKQTILKKCFVVEV